ncbi:hypothetical protein WN51_10776 [Melipona quadrifasciata]|uniref:Uncharacterized protein n=1 Tax=Melipona quadrifasciata TaxID=166423 RepID=A0A0M9A487_9HYME|nr:hypothetical protein WN51_10776 [Melipona quadrifasciata]
MKLFRVRRATSLRRRRMDAGGVGCRYFGLGDDRLYFHPAAAASSCLIKIKGRWKSLKPLRNNTIKEDNDKMVLNVSVVCKQEDAVTNSIDLIESDVKDVIIRCKMAKFNQSWKYLHVSPRFCTEMGMYVYPLDEKAITLPVNPIKTTRFLEIRFVWQKKMEKSPNDPAKHRFRHRNDDRLVLQTEEPVENCSSLRTKWKKKYLRCKEK